MRLCVGRQSMRLQQVPSPSFLLSADSAAAADAAVLESAAPMADVGGPVVVPTGPAVGPVRAAGHHPSLTNCFFHSSALMGSSEMTKVFLRYSFSIVRIVSMQKRRCRNVRRRALVWVRPPQCPLLAIRLRHALTTASSPCYSRVQSSRCS